MVSGPPDTPLADHLLAVSGSPWAVWRRVVLRSTGFPAERALELADPACAGAADELLDAQRAWDEVRARACGDLRRAIDGLARGKGADQAPTGEAPSLRSLRKTLRALRKERLPEDAAAALGSDAAAELETFRDGLAERRRAFGDAYDGALERQSGKLAAIAGDERFQEAILWQNRAAFHTAVLRLAERAPEGRKRNKEQRKHEELVARYLQRYAVKNDTIGFFGPACWARLADGDLPTRVEPGDSLVSRREVFLEAWCVDRLAESLAADAGVRRWLAPRWRPVAELRDGALWTPGHEPRPLPAGEARLLAAVDGETSAHGLAKAAAADFEGGEEEALEKLADYAGKGLLHWGFRIPTAPRMEVELARQIEALPDAPARRRCRRACEDLESARREVAGAAGDPHRLDRTLGELEETFTRLTGQDATRRRGEFYGGRTAIFEECRRDVAVELGDGVWRAAAEPLAIVLQAARWFTWRAAETVRELGGQVYRQLAQETRSRKVEGAAFLRRVQENFGDDQGRIWRAAEDGLEERWAALWSEDPRARRLELRSSELREHARELFAAPHAGWQYGRYHNPDLLIAARDVDALRAGDYRLVLGDLHVARSTFNQFWLVDLHPDPEAMLRAMDLDMPEPRLIPLLPKGFPRLTTRTRLHYFSAKDFYLPSARPAAASVDPERIVPLTSLVVEKSRSGLAVLTRDGRLRLDFVEAFGDALSATAGPRFRVGTTGGGHRPRIEIDRLVVRRESWSWPAGELDFAFEKDAAEIFLAARRFARERQLPRHLFFKTAAEPKPCFVDFESPVYVDILARSIRRIHNPDEGGTGDDAGEASVRFSEMLPAFDDLWLTDGAGRRYPAELRTLFVDRARRPPVEVAGGGRWSDWLGRMWRWIT